MHHSHLRSHGYRAKKKHSKTDLGPTRQKKRVKFCDKHKDKNALAWKGFCQGCGDFKDFTWYPRELQPKFQKFRASWTWMTKREEKLPAFQRPKRWFTPDEWKLTRKMKCFGLTASNGKQLIFEVPYGKGNFGSEKWAGYLKKRVAPFLRRSFPEKRSFHLLLDGEGLLHAPPAKRAMRENGISTLKDWPGYSPELNPAEHVWSQAEPKLRELESGYDEFAEWKKKVLAAVRAYPSPEKLVGSMARRVKDCLDRNGAMIDD